MKEKLSDFYKIGYEIGYKDGIKDGKKLASTTIKQLNSRESNESVNYILKLHNFDCWHDNFTNSCIKCPIYLLLGKEDIGKICIREKNYSE